MLLRLLLLAGVTLAQVDLKGQKTRMIQENVTPMDAVDLNHDGAVTFQEFQKWSQTKQGLDETKTRHLFQQYDANHDEKLHVYEFVPLAYALSQKPLSAAEQIFKQVDLNGDGILSRQEADISRGGVAHSVIDSVFLTADADHDGQITLNEFRSVVDSSDKPERNKDREMAGQLMSFMDQNFDNRLNVQEVHSFANQHSKVSESEVMEAFRFLDSNRDGYIDITELEKLPSRMSQLFAVRPPPTVHH